MDLIEERSTKMPSEQDQMRLTGFVTMMMVVGATGVAAKGILAGNWLVVVGAGAAAIIFALISWSLLERARSRGWRTGQRSRHDRGWEE